MPHVNMKEILKESIAKKYAIGAFPGMDYTIANQIIETNEKLNTPVILLLYGPYIWGKTNDEKRWFDNMWDMLDRAKVPVSMILDHGSYDECFKAIDLGFKSVMFDGSSLPLDENIEKTKKIVEYAHARNVAVEAEIGHVGGDEGTTETGEVATDHFTRVADVKRFVEETNVDALAIAIGSQHGIYKAEPKLDIQRLDEIRAAVGDLPLVMHGGSGIPDAAMNEAVLHGINKVNHVTYMMVDAANKIKEAEAQAQSKGKVLTYYDYILTGNKEMDEYLAHQIEVFSTKPLEL